MGEFSNAITKPDAQPAGLIVKLDTDGKPLVDPTSDLSGETIVDVTGYAPTTDTLSIVQNWCNEPQHSGTGNGRSAACPSHGMLSNKLSAQHA